MGGVTLYREIDALGGTGSGDWHEGYSKALDEVLAILTKRGFSEHGDPVLDALVELNDAGRTAWHFQRQDTNAQHGFATALSKARAAITAARTGARHEA